MGGLELSWLPIRTSARRKEKTLRSNSNHERERDIHTEGKEEGGLDREDEEALLCISSYTSSRVKGANTFVLRTCKVQALVVQEAAAQ